MSTEQHYFMFSAGEYSDYGVGCICVCDHAVSKDEWHAHYQKYQDALHSRRERLGQSMYDEPHWTRQQKWEKQNNPEKTFQEMHRMKKLEALELWRDA